MHSTVNLKETDDPHDGPATAPDVVPAAWADKVLADIKRDGVIRPVDHKPNPTSGVAAPTVDTTFRPTALDNNRALGEKPSSGRWATRAVTAFVFALCSALAAAAWQHYGHTARQMIADWTPPFVLAASPASEKTGLTEQPGSPAVQASAADQTTPQPAAAAQLPDGAGPAAAALASESAQLLQSMARDLATMGQQIEQLKASVAELKAGQQAAPAVARASEVKPPEIKPVAPNPRPKLSAAPPPRPAAAPVHRPSPTYPPGQAAAAAPMPLAAQPAPPPPPAPPPQAAASYPDAEPIVRPPMPMRW